LQDFHAKSRRGREARASFVCAAGGNDVLALLEMMLPLRANDIACATQMMLCLTAQMKKSNSYELDFFG
jgi:hypothetical protein